MKFRIAWSMFAIALLAGGVATGAGEKATSTSVQRFDALKKLAGDWVEVGKDGKATNQVVSSIRITAGGNTIQETLFPGSEHEMVTMYHLDGADLMLTHYCMLGNQPRMRAESGGEVNKIVFKFAGGTNIKSADEHHMHQATINIEGPDRFKAEWVSCKDGKPSHTKNFDLVRKPK
jgi:hypothetical protein